RDKSACTHYPVFKEPAPHAHSARPTLPRRFHGERPRRLSKAARSGEPSKATSDSPGCQPPRPPLRSTLARPMRSAGSPPKKMAEDCLSNGGDPAAGFAQKQTWSMAYEPAAVKSTGPARSAADLFAAP